MVLDPGDHPGAALFLRRGVLGQRELAAGIQAAAGAGGRYRVEIGLVLLHAQLGQRVAVALDDIESGIVIGLVFVDFGDFDQGAGLGHQAGRRGLEVVVGLRPLAGAELPAMLPMGDMVLVEGAAVELDLLLRTEFVGRLVIGQDQGVRTLLVGEEIEDAFFLHQAGDEGEIALAILYAVFAGRMIALQIESVIGESKIAEYLLDDVGRGHLLEDPAIRGLGQEPEPGDHIEIVATQLTALGFSGSDTLHMAVEIPIGFVGRVHQEREMFLPTISSGAMSPRTESTSSR